MGVKDNLIAARENYAALLEECSKRKRTRYSVDGQTFDWLGYQEYLVAKINELKFMIDAEDDDDICEEHTTAVT